MGCPLSSMLCYACYCDGYAQGFTTAREKLTISVLQGANLGTLRVPEEVRDICWRRMVSGDDSTCTSSATNRASSRRRRRNWLSSFAAYNSAQHGKKDRRREEALPHRNGMPWVVDVGRMTDSSAYSINVRNLVQSVNDKARRKAEMSERSERGIGC